MIEEIVRETLIELLNRELLTRWPSNEEVLDIVNALKEEEDDRQARS